MTEYHNKPRPSGRRYLIACYWCLEALVPALKHHTDFSFILFIYLFLWAGVEQVSQNLRSQNIRGVFSDSNGQGSGKKYSSEPVRRHRVESRVAGIPRNMCVA